MSENPITPSCSSEDVYTRAARIISECSFLLITCGAGFSKDSGLSVYNDITNHPIYKQKNLTYHDLARPVDCCDHMPLDYYGFWINCAQTYHHTHSHSGYEILKGWKNLFKQVPEGFEEKQVDILSQSEWFGSGGKMARNMFVYSSNVDNHFSRYFEPCEIYNIHGHSFNWQCGKPCSENAKWDYTEELLKFNVNQETMQINANELDKLNCKYCKHMAMPNVLMFGDLGHYIRNKEEEDRYIAWECSVETYSKDMETKFPFVIIELGCGLTVPSVRLENECVLLDCDKCFLIRINVGTDELNTIHNEELKPLKDERILNIQSGCESALQQIDQALKQLHQ